MFSKKYQKKQKKVSEYEKNAVPYRKPRLRMMMRMMPLTDQTT